VAFNATSGLPLLDHNYLYSSSLTAQQRNNFTTGVRNSSGSHRLSERQLQMLRESLRHKPGFVELGFDREGTLTLGNRQNIAGGSATARALLVAAVDGANLYQLESHDSSPALHRKLRHGITSTP
jgi:hypothetical protein